MQDHATPPSGRRNSLLKIQAFRFQALPLEAETSKPSQRLIPQLLARSPPLGAFCWLRPSALAQELLSAPLFVFVREDSSRQSCFVDPDCLAHRLKVLRIDRAHEFQYRIQDLN